MNFFGQLGELIPGRKSASTGETDESPFAYLAERGDNEGSSQSSSQLAMARYEGEFQTRMAAAAETDRWLQPLLGDLRGAAYPQEKLHDFIHWVNQDSECPWIILSDSLEYGRRHQDVRSELIYWDRHPQPHIRWTIGSYSDHPYARSQSWGYDCKVEVTLKYTNGKPERLQVRRPGTTPEAHYCKVSLDDITKLLVRLHP